MGGGLQDQGQEEKEPCLSKDIPDHLPGVGCNKERDKRGMSFRIEWGLEGGMSYHQHGGGRMARRCFQPLMSVSEHFSSVPTRLLNRAYARVLKAHLQRARWRGGIQRPSDR